MTDLIRTLSNVLGRTVVDKTGFATTFDFYLQFTADESLAGLSVPPPSLDSPNNSTRPVPSPDAYGTIFAAIQEQLGLKLESARGPVDVLVIDSVENPRPIDLQATRLPAAWLSLGSRPGALLESAEELGWPTRE